MLPQILGGIAIGILGLAAGAAIIHAVVSYLDKRETEELVRDELNTELGAIITDIRNSGDCTVVTLESLEKDEILEIEADEVSDDIYEGMEIIIGEDEDDDDYDYDYDDDDYDYDDDDYDDDDDDDDDDYY